MLNSSAKISMEQAVPAPWCWYGDLEIPGFENCLFTIVVQSEDPVITGTIKINATLNECRVALLRLHPQ